MHAPNWECIGSLNTNIPQMKLTRTINDDAIPTISLKGGSENESSEMPRRI